MYGMGWYAGLSIQEDGTALHHFGFGVYHGLDGTYVLVETGVSIYMYYIYSTWDEVDTAREALEIEHIMIKIQMKEHTTYITIGTVWKFFQGKSQFGGYDALSIYVHKYVLLLRRSGLPVCLSI